MTEVQQQVEIPTTGLQPQLESSSAMPDYAQIALEAGQAADAAKAEREALYAQSSFVPSAETRNAETAQTETALAEAKQAREDAIYQKALGKSEDEIYDNAYTNAYLKSIKGTMDQGHYLEGATETQARHDVREPAAAEEARQHAEDELRMARRKAETEVEADRLWQSTYANKLQELGATEVADPNDPNDMFHNAALDAADEAAAAYRQKRRPLVDKLSNAVEQFGLGAATGRQDAAEDRAAAQAAPKPSPKVKKATVGAQPGADPGDGDKSRFNQKFTPGVYQSIFAGENRSQFQQDLAEEASHGYVSGVEAIAADMLHNAQEAQDDQTGDRLWRDYSTFLQNNNLKHSRINTIVSDVLWANPPAGQFDPNGKGEFDDDDDEFDDDAGRSYYEEDGPARKAWASLTAEVKRAGGDLAWAFGKLRNSRPFRRWLGTSAVAATQQPDQNV